LISRRAFEEAAREAGVDTSDAGHELVRTVYNEGMERISFRAYRGF
jgi:hypothetical protein